MLIERGEIATLKMQALFKARPRSIVFLSLRTLAKNGLNYDKILDICINIAYSHLKPTRYGA
jgi:hypothetical protein